MVSRPLRAAVGTVLWTPTGCDGGSKPCELFDVVPQVAVTWQVDALPYSEDSAYGLWAWPSTAEAVRRAATAANRGSCACRRATTNDRRRFTSNCPADRTQTGLSLSFNLL
jgi:hypothetical protein